MPLRKDLLGLALSCVLAFTGCSHVTTQKAPFLARTSGRSMLPYIKNRDVVFIGVFPYDKLEPGMVADRSGILHALKAYNPKDDSWTMQGTYNPQPDTWPLTRKNYIGVVPGMKVPLVFPSR